MRCIDIFGGYSEAFQKVTVNTPTEVDVNALGDQLTNLRDEQNTGKLVALAGAFVSTLTASGVELTDDQKNLQMQMTDTVNHQYHYHFFFYWLRKCLNRAITIYSTQKIVDPISKMYFIYSFIY